MAARDRVQRVRGREGSVKLSELRPCDKCGGKIAPIFYVVRFSIAVFDQRKMNTNLGLTQMFQGSVRLAEVFSPDPEVGVVAMDSQATKLLMTELFICNDCYSADLNLGVLAEKREAASAVSDGGEVK
jgi:hypothetical protein